MSIRLSVNINKIATLRNARGGNNPDVIRAAVDCEKFGADGITVHPRPDERHIRYSDIPDLKMAVQTEFNIEGYPDENFMTLVESIQPEQVTLVPDPPNVLTSNAGWDTIKNFEFLSQIVSRLHASKIRVSIFLEPDPQFVDAAACCGTDRIELYTEMYARKFPGDPLQAVQPYINTAQAALDAGLQINAGHDLDLKNLRYFAENVPGLVEVSIGHALICDALYFGLQNVIPMYKNQLRVS